MKTLIKKLMERAGYTVKRTRSQNSRPLKTKHFFDLYFSRIDPTVFFFVQIGAHDGRHRDPLYPYVAKYRLRGLALEPQKAVFAQLQHTYQNYPGVTCINVALAKSSGSLPFYTVEGDSSLGTFNKNLLPTDRGPVQESLVPTVTFNELVRQYRVGRVDFLQIDCEGYDYEILKMMDFKKFTPQIINFEHVLLSETDRRAAEELLVSYGYEFFRHGMDTCAYKL
jgi:FkbM family methyltransferase